MEVQKTRRRGRAKKRGWREDLTEKKLTGVEVYAEKTNMENRLCRDRLLTALMALQAASAPEEGRTIKTRVTNSASHRRYELGQFDFNFDWIDLYLDLIEANSFTELTHNFTQS